MPDGGVAPISSSSPAPALVDEGRQQRTRQHTSEDRPSPCQDSAQAARPPAVVLALSGDTAEAVEEARTHYLRALRDGALSRSPADLAYTATVCADVREYRIAASGKSAEDLHQALRAAPVEAAGKRRKVVFLFSGQGGQYRGMGGGLYDAVPSFRREVDRCEEKLGAWGLEGMRDFIKGTPDDESAESLEVVHTALFVVGYALARMWQSWGVEPDAILGHSLGEYAALVCAGVLSLDDTLRLVWQRARLTSERCTKGSSGMLVIMAEPNMLEKMIGGDEKYDQLSMACHNSDTNCVVGGNIEQLKLLEDACKEQALWCRLLQVPYAYHNATMDPILDELRELGKQVSFAAPSTPIVATAYGKVIRADDASVLTSGYFAHHARAPVLFQQGIQDLVSHIPELAEEGVWLEIGPHATTLPLLRLHRAVTQGSVQLPSLCRGEADAGILCQTLARLYCVGMPVVWQSVFGDMAPAARAVAGT